MGDISKCNSLTHNNIVQEGILRLAQVTGTIRSRMLAAQVHIRNNSSPVMVSTCNNRVITRRNNRTMLLEDIHLRVQEADIIQARTRWE